MDNKKIETLRGDFLNIIKNLIIYFIEHKKVA
jgi:hypothetical protein